VDFVALLMVVVCYGQGYHYVAQTPALYNAQRLFLNHIVVLCVSLKVITPGVLWEIALIATQWQVITCFTLPVDTQPHGQTEADALIAYKLIRAANHLRQLQHGVSGPVWYAPTSEFTKGCVFLL
jgi:hypothetical protein